MILEVSDYKYKINHKINCFVNALIYALENKNITITPVEAMLYTQAVNFNARIDFEENGVPTLEIIPVELDFFNKFAEATNIRLDYYSNLDRDADIKLISDTIKDNTCVTAVSDQFQIGFAISEVYKKLFPADMRMPHHFITIHAIEPESGRMLAKLAGVEDVTEPARNNLSILDMEGHKVWVARTGYTGEPIGYEIFLKNEDADWAWNRLLELGAKPAGLGARDTLRMEAMLPLYGDEMGIDEEGKDMPIFGLALARFAVSFDECKGDFIGRAALSRQAAAQTAFREKRGTEADLIDLPKRVRPITLKDRGVMRHGMEVFYKGEKVGYVTSATMIPYYKTEGEGAEARLLEETGKRAIGIAFIRSDVPTNAEVEVDVRGKRLKAVIPLKHVANNVPPYVIPVIAE